MQLFINIFTFYLGAIVGSFLNVCIHRLPRGESIVSPPSHCPRCNEPVRPYDNLPLFSYLFLRGRCRYCKARISPRYFVVELITGIAFLALGAYFISSPGMLVVSCVFVCSMIVVVFIDAEHQIIPDEISLGGIGFGLLASLAYPGLHHSPSYRGSIVASVLGLAVGGGLFWLIRFAGGKFFKKEAMGLGDVKLMAYIGSLLGPSLVLLTTFFAALIGSAAGLMLISSRKAHLSSRLPFGPFLCIGAVISFFWGARCVAWYLGLFH